MEEEKKDNKKAGMKRALNVRDILNKKYDVFPFEGKWKDAFDTPESGAAGSCGVIAATERPPL